MNTATQPPSPVESLSMLLRALKLPSFARHSEEAAQRAQREGLTYGQYLHHLAEIEIEERRRRKIDRNLKASGLLREKSLATLDRGRLPARAAKTLPSLCEGEFVERGDNLLVFGLPGRGKTHLVCAIGHELIQRGVRVLFTPTYALVQRLLAAKRELRLEKELAILDRFDAVILDDLGYVKQSRDEMEVLFTFFAERYERRSILIYVIWNLFGSLIGAQLRRRSCAQRRTRIGETDSLHFRRSRRPSGGLTSSASWASPTTLWMPMAAG